MPTNLTDGTHNASANVIKIVGNDIYVAGFENNGAHDVAKIWKNGIGTAITDGLNEAEISSMAVVGTDVYAVGLESSVSKTEKKDFNNDLYSLQKTNQHWDITIF